MNDCSVPPMQLAARAPTTYAGPCGRNDRPTQFPARYYVAPVAMGVLLQAFYLRGTRGVPSPADDDRRLPWWWDHLAAQARELRQVGFTAIWLPPVWKSSAGTLSVGYDMYDDYDLG